MNCSSNLTLEKLKDNGHEVYMTFEPANNGMDTTSDPIWSRLKYVPCE